MKQSVERLRHDCSGEAVGDMRPERVHVEGGRKRGRTLCNPKQRRGQLVAKEPGPKAESEAAPEVQHVGPAANRPSYAGA